MTRKQNRLSSSVLTAAVAVFGLSGVASAAAFTAGDLVIYRVGDGTTALANTGNSVFLDEYTPAGGLVQSIALPNAGSGALISSGTATSEGMINLSANGQYLALTGYNQAPNATGSIVSGSAPRIVDVIGSGGTVVNSAALTDFAVGNNPRSAYTTDGINLYVAGAAGGVRDTTGGLTGSAQLSTTVTNLRDVTVAGGQLYVTSSSGGTPTSIRVATVGTGTPTTAGQAITDLPGVSPTNASAGTGNSTSPYQVVFEDLTPAVAGLDTMYVADDTITGGEIQKFSLVGGTWTLNGTIAAAGVRGLTASVDANGNVDLFGTTGGSTATGGGSLYAYVDTTGYNAAPTTGAAATILASAAADEAFRGIAFVPVNSAPVPEPTAAGLAAAGIAVLVRRRRRSA